MHPSAVDLSKETPLLPQWNRIQATVYVVRQGLVGDSAQTQ